MLKNMFSFLFQRPAAEERVAHYVLREHARGRALQEILADHYVVNRLERPEQRARLLDRPEIVHAFGANDIAAMTAKGTDLSLSPSPSDVSADS